MPNRILREGILTSERINSLNWEAEVFYRRLMSVVDDFGRFTAHPQLLRAALYPLKLDTVRDANMERLLALVEQARLVRVYEVAGKRYLELLDFKQQVRAKESKWPHPPSPCAADATQKPSRSAAPAHVFGDGDGVEGDNPQTPADAGASGFSRFWAAWPENSRKAAEDKCRKEWGTQQCEPQAAAVLSRLEAAKLSPEWLEQAGKFIPAPWRWLNERRWEARDGAVVAPVLGVQVGETQAYLAEQAAHKAAASPALVASEVAEIRARFRRPVQGEATA